MTMRTLGYAFFTPTPHKNHKNLLPKISSAKKHLMMQISNSIKPFGPSNPSKYTFLFFFFLYPEATHLSLSMYLFPFTLIHSSEFVLVILILALNKEFKDKRKIHYNEYSKVKLARKLIEQELKDLEDDDDSVANNTKEGPSSSQDTACTQVIKCICCNNQTSEAFHITNSVLIL